MFLILKGKNKMWYFTCDKTHMKAAYNMSVEVLKTYPQIFESSPNMMVQIHFALLDFVLDWVAASIGKCGGTDDIAFPGRLQQGCSFRLGLSSCVLASLLDHSFAGKSGAMSWAALQRSPWGKELGTSVQQQQGTEALRQPGKRASKWILQS